MARSVIVPCFCTACGHKAKRSSKNLHRPCPKCGGPMSISKEDHEMLVVSSIAAIILMGLFAIIMSALKH